MAGKVIFALSAEQARVIDAITRPGYKLDVPYRVLDALARRWLIQEVRGRWTLTADGYAVQELVRHLDLHRPEAHQG